MQQRENIYHFLANPTANNKGRSWGCFRVIEIRVKGFGWDIKEEDKGSRRRASIDGYAGEKPREGKTRKGGDGRLENWEGKAEREDSIRGEMTAGGYGLRVWKGEIWWAKRKTKQRKSNGRVRYRVKRNWAERVLREEKPDKRKEKAVNERVTGTSSNYWAEEEPTATVIVFNHCWKSTGLVASYLRLIYPLVFGKISYLSFCCFFAFYLRFTV